MKADLLDCMGSDLTVANVARVSMGKWHTEFNPETDTRLIEYLAKNGHWSPFSHPKAQFRLEMPIFVARQWEKHRIGVVRGYDIYDQNEQSRRYVDDSPEFWEPHHWRMRPESSIKQGSGGLATDLINAAASYDLREAHRFSLIAYRKMIDAGIAPEMARAILPQSMYTTWIETGSLAYWARLCQLRLDPHAQQEIQHLASQVSDQMAVRFPVSWDALMWHES